MKIYDLEHHYFSKAYTEYLLNIKNNPSIEHDQHLDSVIQSLKFKSNNLPDQLFENEVACKNDTDLKIMDSAGLEYGVLSTSDGLEILPHDLCIELSMKTNDDTAKKMKEHPDRFLGTFCLPTPYVEESLKEIDRAVDELGLLYYHTHSSYGDTRLSKPKYEPIIRKCAEKNIPIYIHPCYPTEPYLNDLGFAFSGAGFGFTADVMKTFIELVVGGVFDRYPNLKIIIGHMGEFFPYTMARMDNMIDIFKGQDPYIKCKYNFTHYCKNRNIFITTSGIFDEKVVKFAIDKVGIDNIFFGADFPYENCKRSVDFILNADISKVEKEKICFKNAEKYILNQKH